MIRYDLVCERDHRFDGWFRDSKAFDDQVARQAIGCPTCGSTAIQKQIMAPAVRSRREAAKQTFAAPQDQRSKLLLEALRKVRRHVEENAENVGQRFPEEARRIHYREVEPRGIYGEATPDEARELVEEGIEIHPLPRLPDDAN